MRASYDKLWILLIERKMKKTDLIQFAGISSNVLAKMGKEETISMESMRKICEALRCDIGDVMSFVD